MGTPKIEDTKMNTNSDKKTLLAHEVKELMKQKPDTILIDLLPPDHYAKIHLPDAQNACVYMVSFLDDIAGIVPDNGARVVVYGSSSQSLDAKVALDKLDREGYQNVSYLDGGIAGWRAEGYIMEGVGPDQPDDPQTRLCIEDGVYIVDTVAGRVEWVGRNPNTRHHGTVNIASGRVKVETGMISGTFEMDMDTIHNINLEGDELHPVLEQHLKSDDFFFVKVFPKAVFTIKEGKPADPAWLTLPNYSVKGELNLRGVSAPLEFEATVNKAEKNRLAIESHFDIDRTQWSIIYGSARYFEYLGMHKVFDLISIQVNLVVDKQP
jgi:rhodanese-related sulfurtransferase/polyisoprenoid-binding protein YceI